MEKYDIAIVLAKDLEREGNRLKLSGETKERVDLGMSLLWNNQAERLLMSGGHGVVGECYGKSIAQVMKEYAMLHGVKEEEIIIEDLSLDTVGQLILCRARIIEPMKIKSAVLVTHEDHYERVKAEAETVLRGIKLGYAIVPSGFSPEVVETEKRSLQVFYKTFEGVDFSKNREGVKALMEKHPKYKEKKDYFSKILEKVIEYAKV